MSGLNLTQVKALIIRPVLAEFPDRYGTEAAVNLLAGTMLAESGGINLAQLGGGPARGLWQMEQETHDDCYVNFLNFQGQEVLKITVQGFLGAQPSDPMVAMCGNLFYACAMARVKYIRSPLALPAATDAVAMADYHKAVYNSAFGSANATANVPLFQAGIDA
jgi:hypothetical protein